MIPTRAKADISRAYKVLGRRSALRPVPLAGRICGQPVAGGRSRQHAPENDRFATVAKPASSARSASNR